VASDHRLSATPIGGREHSGTETPDTRVLLAIGSLLILLAGAILVAVLLIVRLADDATAVTDRQGRYVRAVHEVAIFAKGVANDQRGFLLTGKSVFLDELNERHLKAQAAFAVAARSAADEGQILAVEEARIGYARWWKELNADIATFQAGDQRGSIARSLGATRELRKDYERALDLAYVLGVGSLEAEKTSVAKSSSRSVMFLLAYLVFALVVGGAIALWVVRTVLRPAYTLLRSVDDARSPA
jgi:methyl-accepting chemotaxis protein